VLIDPPFERRDEYERLFDSLQAALRKWPGGTYMVWQPVKEPDVAEAFCRAVAAEADDCLRIDLQAESPQAGKPLARTGLLIVNPPYVLEEEMKTILAALTPLLARGSGADFFITRYGAAQAM
jgi:23S rRNA (adenine2030-N6)-methyltransferase